MYLPSEQRRVQAAFDKALPPPYEAEITMEELRKSMRVAVADPDDATKTVVQAVWWYEERWPRGTPQPAQEELNQIVAAFVKVCNDHLAEQTAGPVEG